MIPPIFHYTGNKFKRLPQILTNMPKCKRIVEPFGGSGVVSFNAVDSAKAESLWYNEIDKNIFDLTFNAITMKDFIKSVESLNLVYEPTKNGYESLRNDYNMANNKGHREPINFAMLYLLICRSFNNQTRFNKSGEFNLPFGSRNYIRTEGLRKVRKMHQSGVSMAFSSVDFGHVLDTLEDGDLVFLDPPYTGTTATYNAGWNAGDDERLYEWLEFLNNNGVMWMLTNVVENRGNVNQRFKDFVDENMFNSVVLDGSYANSSFHKSNSKTIELLVTNFDLGD